MKKIIENADLKNALMILADYGLGATMIHMHDENGEISPLQNGMVQLEKNLNITFVNSNSEELKNAVPVTWEWCEGEIKTVAYCCK